MKSIFRVFLLVALTCSFYSFGCGGGGSGGSGGLGDIVACNAATNDGCETDLDCEYVTSGDTGCFEPIVLKGKVFNLASGAAIEGARVVALDANGSVASNVAVTNAEGNYEISPSVKRDAEGNPASGQSVTLRADAAGFQTFPGGVRQALPIDATAAVKAQVLWAKSFVLQTALTDVGLIAFEAGAPTASIYGTAELPETIKGTLVVAELSATQGYTAIADLAGGYRIFNLPAGAYTVRGYTQGSNYNPAAVTLADAESKEANLTLSGYATATLNGSVQIVNPGSGDTTSVILAVESTFNENLVRGEMPPGLRAPSPGTDPNIKGSFTIEGIPAGRYVVLAAFENDYLVRDPDTCISGTDILHQEFTAGQTVDLSDGFKITGSLDVISPGAAGPEEVATTTPTFTWQDDSSEENYRVTVLDSFGNTVWQTTIPGVSSGNPSVTYDADGSGALLESGMFYQFKAVSTHTKGGSTCEISQTEDLKGVFYIQ